ncbi:MAG TPA: NAD-dependent epimerase/dehydratase family protein [Thermoplasmata archaeon]|nr:NAD-dependent epimerase/dehydratase family protein [Thermoplasmata archaeon]
MSGPATRPPLLLVGGSGGLVGRSIPPAFGTRFRIHSLHRTLVPQERATGIEWIPADAGQPLRWESLVTPQTTVLNLAWYRWGPESAFRELYEGLSRLLEASVRVGVRRFLHVSVPEAPPQLEEQLPYLTYKRRFDRKLQESGLSYRVLRPSMLFGPGDRLLRVMTRMIRRYRRFPMFGEGEYRLSPLAAADLARILAAQAFSREDGVLDVGGPVSYAYRELTDLIFRSLGLRPRYWHLSARGALRLVRLLRLFGSRILYPYEVEWLMSGRLALPPYLSIDPPLQRVDSYLADLSRGGAAKSSGNGWG